MAEHRYLQGAGQTSHEEIDRRLPTQKQKDLLEDLDGAPDTVSGARDDPEGALADLLSVLEGLGLITDSTTAS